MIILRINKPIYRDNIYIFQIRYKIEKYDRIIYGKEKGAAVDFGDYSYFMLITPGEDMPEIP